MLGRTIKPHPVRFRGHAVETWGQAHGGPWLWAQLWTSPSSQQLPGPYAPQLATFTAEVQQNLRDEHIPLEGSAWGLNTSCVPAYCFILLC